MKQMKKLILTTFLLIGILHLTHATVWTVSNDPYRPAQFTTIQAAVDNAAPSDTLRIAGSSIQYGEYVSIKIPLTLIGEGANNPDGENTRIYGLSLQRLNNSISASGSRIYGIEFHGSQGVKLTPHFSGGVEEDFVLSDIQFERCHFNNGGLEMYLYNNSSISAKFENLLFRHCSFTQQVKIHDIHIGTVFTNCIISSDYIWGYGDNLNGGVILRNCLFLNKTNHVFYNMVGLIVENSIFYKCEPTGAENSVFNNNITYLCNDNTLPYGTNVGSGNLENVNPIFADYPALGANFDWAHDYSLLPGSPGIGTGTNGTNIGLDGGNAPVANIPGHSRIPVVDNLILPTSSVPVGGNLEIQIQAHTRD